jgi:predicted helicase
MSKLLVSQYHAEVDRIIQYGGKRSEANIRNAFERLLNEYCKPKNFLLIPELEFRTKNGKIVRPDGTVKDALRLDWGFWESKDQFDSLDREIEKKLEKGYPNDNILFEDSQTAVLIQAGTEIARVSMRSSDELDRILNAFTNYVRPEVKDFQAAIRTFRQDLPTMLDTLRSMIQVQEASNPAFRDRRNQFWEVCKRSINPEITLFDIQEMIIQHVLTEDIFLNIFNESQFHRENNIARELHQVIETFFTGSVRKNTLSTIERYYAVIRRTAANIYNHHEKQKFLKAVYENFYKIYDPKAADRLGIVYTPNEIVRFMIESVDHLLHKHFDKLLSEPGIKILDPCTGTATYITELIEYLPKDKLEHKYRNEIFCNEVGILPYYIANLNIEYTYQQKVGKYEEFQNICLVDTLEHTTFENKQFDLFSMSVENTERIRRQNEQEIFVVIGNPPYNANQQSENDGNKNRTYKSIDERIRATYVKRSSAQKTKAYDMYSRFFRWASDRLGDNGILAFITNSSFVHMTGFDGFRKVALEEFSDIYLIDLGGDVRANPKLSGTKHNVFGIQTGVVISFMLKKTDTCNSSLGCRVHYHRRPELEHAEEKLSFLSSHKLANIDFRQTLPTSSEWINLTKTNFDELVLLVDKQAKFSKNENIRNAIFEIVTMGVATNRDEWLYDFDRNNLREKVYFLVETYNAEIENLRDKKCFSVQELNLSIKWSETLVSHLKKQRKVEFNESKIVSAFYRPFTRRLYYADSLLSDRLTTHHSSFFGAHYSSRNPTIGIIGISTEIPFSVLAFDRVNDLNSLSPAAGGNKSMPLYRYDKDGNRHDNITDWGLTQFQTHYNDSSITKENIFHYTYAVLHHPAYRTKYELNLKREFPRLPFYDYFYQWVNWGKQLMDLHIGYESVERFGLVKREQEEREQGTEKPPKAKLKADKENGVIVLDDNTRLEGVPAVAWTYKLGNRSALEWILDQYKEKKPKDPTIAAKFNTYRFADYKEHVIELLDRVCTVSIKTMTIIQQMPIK